MADLPPGWVALLVAVVAALQGCLSAYLARRNSREHDRVERTVREGNDQRSNP